MFYNLLLVWKWVDKRSEQTWKRLRGPRSLPRTSRPPRLLPIQRTRYNLGLDIATPWEESSSRPRLGWESCPDNRSRSSLWRIECEGFTYVRGLWKRTTFLGVHVRNDKGKEKWVFDYFCAVSNHNQISSASNWKKLNRNRDSLSFFVWEKQRMHFFKYVSSVVRWSDRGHCQEVDKHWFSNLWAETMKTIISKRNNSIMYYLEMRPCLDWVGNILHFFQKSGTTHNGPQPTVKIFTLLQTHCNHYFIVSNE